MKWNTIRVLVLVLHIAALTSAWWAVSIWGLVTQNGFPLIVPTAVLSVALFGWLLPTLDAEWNK